MADITNARRIGESFARENFEATIGARGTIETAAEIKAVDTEADRLDGRDVTVDINADQAGLRSLSEGFKNLASNIRATGTILSAASIPFGIAAIGAGIPTIAALAASLGGLTVALGAGLVGATVAATAALGGLAGAFGLVAAPVSLLLGNLKEYDDSLDAVSSAEATARSAAQSRADALRTLSEAQANVATTARDSRDAVAEQEEALRRTRSDAASSIAAAEQSLAEARRSGAEGVQEAETGLAQARREATESITDAERTLQQTRVSAADANANAEGELESARDALASATRSLSSAQDELNRALREEPLNQDQATLDLASARDRASDSLRAYNEAVAEFGANSEEASDARRELSQANLDLQQTEIDVRDARRNGSDELQNAREAARSAADDQRSSAEAVKEAEQGVVDARAEGVQQILEQQRALRETRGDAQGQIREQAQALAQARAERIRGEREAMAEVVEVRRDAAQEIQDAEEALADTSREGALRVVEAQKLVADAQRAAATAAKEAATAQKAVREETVKLTPAQKALFNEYERFKKIADTAFLGAQNAAARLGVSILNLAESFLPRLGRVSEDTIGALTRSFQTFRSELAQPVEQAGITRYLALIPDLTETAATAAGRLGLALFNVFSRSLRFALPLTTAVGDLADEFLRWTESARGTRAIDTFFENSVDMALRLLPAIQDLVGGFGNLVGALQRTGIVDQSVRGFKSLADSFERSTREGGGLDRFLRQVRDLMPFVAKAATAVGGAILGIAKAAVGAREGGSKLTVLQGIFKGIAASARPLQNLVVGTFRNLGPAIADLLPALSRFFATLAGASGPLVTFVQTITKVLTLFNKLPPGIKTTIAQLVALKVILGGLGITALVAPLGRFASNMFLASRAAAKLKIPLAASGVAATGATGKFKTLGGVIKAVGVGLLGFARFAGPVGLVLATIATAAVLVWKNWDKIKIAVKPVSDALQVFWKNVGPGVREVLQTLGQSLKTVAKGFLSAVAPGKSFKEAVGGIIDGLTNFIKNAAPPVIAALKSVNHWLKENQPLFKAIGRFVGTVLVIAWKGLVKSIQAGIDVLRIVAGVFDKVKGAAQGTAKIINNVIDKIKEFIPDFKKSGENAAIAFLTGFKEGGLPGGVSNVVEEAWEGLRAWQGEHSPATKLWPQSGKNAALGWLKGFTDTMKSGQGQLGRSLEAAQGTASGRQAIAGARAANSPGGRSITAAEMRDIMREAHKAQAKNIYAAAVAAGLDPRVLRLLDSIMAKDFNFRTNMLADAR